MVSWIASPLVKFFDLIFISALSLAPQHIVEPRDSTHWIFTSAKEFPFSVYLLCARLCSMGWKDSMNTVDKNLCLHEICVLLGIEWNQMNDLHP